jgi:hypothetical protein
VLGRDTVIRIPHDATVIRKDGEKVVDVHDDRRSVEMQDENATITLFFARDGDARTPVEVRLVPTAGGRFAPWNLIPRLPRLVQYASGCLAWDRGGAGAALEALRESGKARRGLSDDMLRIVVDDYKTLIADGEPHPIKALANLRSVDKSTASRWVTAARRRGLLEQK